MFGVIRLGLSLQSLPFERDLVRSELLEAIPPQPEELMRFRCGPKAY